MQRRKFLLTTAASAASAVALPLASLAESAAPPKRSRGYLVKAHTARLDQKTLLGHSPNDLKIAAQDTGADLSIFEYTGHDQGGPPLHIHLAQDEVFYIVEGEYLFQLGEEKFRATAGDTVFAPRQVPHTFAQVSAEGRMFYLFQPAGSMEAFFRESGEIKGAPTPAQAEALFARHELKIMGPPLAF